MTTMLESPVALRRGRDLVSPELFEKVSEFCSEEYGHELSAARRIVDQALAFLKVMGDTRAFDMSPSDAVDPGWHSFVLHTQAYAAWCDEQFGFFLGHEPKATVRTRPLIGSVVDRVKEAGFYVDDRLWGAAKECNPPACCGDGDGC
ncbi:hypothetical protein GCM10010347_07700 [Streptomyces cirratus]|uniref:Uncharacterized protein n=1 Tax=Streptomyces cirratus TaxID=68187 RepID=A0ABQ3ELI9_9ACTN|nr:hypothetical protein [Streptomyces cirratus]GHB40535.1 hypothetical protein GCM10010347_07700 [Streptomyces cirratus]